VERLNEPPPEAPAGPYGSGPRTPEAMDAVTAALVGLDAVAVETGAQVGNGAAAHALPRQRPAVVQEGLGAVPPGRAVGDAERMVAVIPGLIRLWQIADAQAVEDGHQPLAPDVWETRLPDGRVLAIARTNAEAIAVQRDGRATVAFSLAEIARLLPKLELMDAVKTGVPRRRGGARGAARRRLRRKLGHGGPAAHDAA
jgi:hypothetical protein